MAQAPVDLDPPQLRTHSVLRSVLVVLVVLYLLGGIVGGIGGGWIALHPPVRPILPSKQKQVEEAAASDSIDLEDVAITTADGVTLRAWFMRPRDANGNVVILLHGVGDNRLGMYGYGRALLSQHYAVLLPDARAHGLSGGLASYGVKESEDIHQWVSWIEDHEFPRCVYGLGESMGAAQLLQSLAKEPRFCAVVAESPFPTFREIAYARFGQPFHTGPWLGSTFFRPAVEAGFLYARVEHGLDMETAAPVEAVRNTKVPILLIHGMSDTNIPPFHSDEIQAANPGGIVLWKVPGAVHTGAYRAAPEEFRRRVEEWFESHGRAE
jgi:dipeptidyl aminopeptidase/acylaminoacyl peptidase